MIFATSSGVPSRCSGICWSTIFSVPGDRIEVSISPGAIELTRTPTRPKSDAISRVNEASAAFEVAYAAPANGCTRQPARHHDRREEIDPEYMAPGVDVGIDRTEPAAACRFRRNRGVVDQRVQC